MNHFIDFSLNVSYCFNRLLLIIILSVYLPFQGTIVPPARHSFDNGIVL